MMELAERPSALANLNHATIAKNGLQIEKGLSQEAFTHGVIKPLRELVDYMQESALWWWGDALAYADANYGETYTKAVEASGYSYSSLKLAKAVSQRIKLSSRLDNLSWSHHLEVAYAVKDADQRDYWLGMASKGTDGKPWSKSELRKALRVSKQEVNDDPNEDAGEMDAIKWAKDLAAHFNSENFQSWSRERWMAWEPDIQRLWAIYETMSAKYPI